MRRLLLAAGIIAALLIPAAVAYGAEAPSLSVVSQSNDARVLTFSAGYPAGISAVKVALDGVEATRIPVSPDVTGSVRFALRVDLAKTAAASALDGAGKVVAKGSSLALSPSSRKPAWISLGVKQGQLVGER